MLFNQTAIPRQLCGPYKGCKIDRTRLSHFQAEMLLMHDHNRVDGPGVALEP